jgi:bisphosphoglycerate-dependent phosphoglycerate mutase
MKKQKNNTLNILGKLRKELAIPVELLAVAFGKSIRSIYVGGYLANLSNEKILNKKILKMLNVYFLWLENQKNIVGGYIEEYENKR